MDSTTTKPFDRHDALAYMRHALKLADRLPSSEISYTLRLFLRASDADEDSMDSTTPLGLSDEQIDKVLRAQTGNLGPAWFTAFARAVIAAHEQAQAKAQGAASVEVPGGWQLVPIEPTQAMTEAICSAHGSGWPEAYGTHAQELRRVNAEHSWELALAAAPTAPQSKPEQPTEPSDVLDAQRWRMASTSRQHGITDWHQFGQRTVYGELAEQIIDAAIRAAKTGGAT